MLREMRRRPGAWGKGIEPPILKQSEHGSCTAFRVLASVPSPVQGTCVKEKAYQDDPYLHVLTFWLKVQTALTRATRDWRVAQRTRGSRSSEERESGLEQEAKAVQRRGGLPR